MTVLRVVTVCTGSTFTENTLYRSRLEASLTELEQDPLKICLVVKIVSIREYPTCYQPSVLLAEKPLLAVTLLEEKTFPYYGRILLAFHYTSLLQQRAGI